MRSLSRGLLGVSDFSWCEELEKLEATPTCQIRSGASLPMPRPEPLLNKLLRVAAVVLSQGRGPMPRSYSSKPRAQGLCRHYPRHCNLMAGGQICRRSGRLTQHCPFKGGFAPRGDGTLSTKLTEPVYVFLLHQLRNRELRRVHG